MRRCTVLLENEASWQNSLVVCNHFRYQFNVKIGVHLGLLWYEVQSSFTAEADASQNHDMWRKLGSLNQKAILIHLTLLSDSTNTVVHLTMFRQLRLLRNF